MATHDRTATTELGNLVDRMSEGFVAVDEEWTVTVCNRRARTILDLSGADVIGVELWELLPEAVDTPLYERCQRAQELGTREIFETELTCLDAVLSVRCYPTDAGLSMYVRNVSLSRHRETELTRYATVVEAVSDGIVVFDESRTVTMVNEALETLLDVFRGRIIGRSVAELDECTALSEANVTTLADAVGAIQNGATERQLDLDVSHDDRSALGLRLVPLPTGSQGTVAGVVRDITDRYERERVVTALHDATQQLFERTEPRAICAAAVHTSADVLDLRISGIWLLDEEYNRLDPIAATSGARENFGGLPHFTDTAGPVWDVFRTGEPALHHDVDETTSGEAPELPVRSELIVPIGDRGVLLAGDPDADAFDEHDLELAELLAAHTEVALERSERERRLGSKTAELERREQRLRTVDRILEGPLDDVLADLEAAIADESDADERLATAARLLADASRIAGGPDDPIRKESCELADVADEAAEALEAASVLDARVDGTVRADPDRLVRLFVAFLRLAGDENATGDVAIDVPGEKSPRSDQLLVEIDGTVPTGDDPTAVDPSASDATASIELAVARRIVHDHGWTLDVESTTTATHVRLDDLTTLAIEDTTDA